MDNNTIQDTNISNEQLFNKKNNMNNQQQKNHQQQYQNKNIFENIKGWTQLSYGCKCLFITTITIFILSYFYNQLPQQYLFWGYKVFYYFQIKRIFLSYQFETYQLSSIINIIIKFTFLSTLFSYQERKLSTVYFIVDTFIQNLLISLTLILISYIFYDQLQLNPYYFGILSIGFSPLILLFLWIEVSNNPEGTINLSFLPILISIKSTPHIFLIYTLISQGFIGYSLGYLQFMYCKRRFIRLPFRFYQTIQRLILSFIKNRDNFVRIKQVKQNLLLECLKCGQEMNQNDNKQDGSKQQKANAQDFQNRKVQDYKKRWRDYDINEQIESKIQIQQQSQCCYQQNTFSKNKQNKQMQQNKTEINVQSSNSTLRFNFTNQNQ